MPKDVYRYLAEGGIDSLDRMAAARMATMFQEVFRSSSYGEAEERFERHLDPYQEMPSA